MAHKDARNDLTAEEVREIFDYEPEYGALTRRKDGKIVGSVHDKYRRTRVNIRGKPYFTYRIIWLWVTGLWPEYEIDHIDGDGGNNRWSNLRAATSTQNMCNTRTYANNKSGYRGVCFDKSRNKWKAEIAFGKVKQYLGRFSTKSQAIDAYNRAAAVLHREFSRVA